MFPEACGCSGPEVVEGAPDGGGHAVEVAFEFSGAVFEQLEGCSFDHPGDPRSDLVEVSGASAGQREVPGGGEEAS
jgi:hypothetical protein